MHIGKRIQEVVNEREISIPDFADSIFCSRKHVYKLFKKSNINTDLLWKISIILNYDFFADYSKSIHFGDSIQNGDKN